MRMYPKEFPPKRRRKPTRRAELRIFNALASSPLHGFAYYEWRKDFDDPELDFAVWIQDLGRAALQVEGRPLPAGQRRLGSAHQRRRQSHPIESDRRGLDVGPGPP